MFLNTLCSLLWFLALEAVCKQVPSYDLVPLWQVVLKTFGGTVYEPWIYKLLLIQWAVWLSECNYEGILHLLLPVNHRVCIVKDNHLMAFEQDRRTLPFKCKIKDSVKRSMFNKVVCPLAMITYITLFICNTRILQTIAYELIDKSVVHF